MAKIPSLGIWHHRHQFSPVLVLTVLFVSLPAINFGYDVSIFGSIQAMVPFTHEFGVLGVNGKYALAAPVASAANATPFLAKLFGTLICGPLMERFGRKLALFCIALISIVGVILQISATSIAQYIVGRCICYAATGFTICVVPAYESECAPAELRGAIIATLQLWLLIGQVVGSAVTYATSTMTSRSSWLIPTGVQFIVPVFILMGLPFVPESPRWLLSKGRREQALGCLIKFRRRGIPHQDIEKELELLSLSDATHGKGRWIELFQGVNRRRTLIAVVAMFGQQITGQTFVSQYGVVFYQLQNITNPSPFLLGLIGNLCGLVSVFLASILVDSFGRRPLLLFGSTFMAFWIYMVAGFGSLPNPTNVQKNVMVASLQLFGITYGASWAPLGYIIMGETPTGRLREKTATLATSISVITTFVVSFSLPYLLNAPYAALGAKVGWIYGSMAIATFFLALFVIPEQKNRSLEELDELYDARVPTMKFNSYKTSGIGREILVMEEAVMEKGMKSREIRVEESSV